MGKLIKGLGILVALVIVLIIALLVLIDPIAKWVIETEGSKAVKAEVTVDRVDVRFFPPGATLNDLAVTNPQSPMRNALEAATIQATLDFAPLLSGKVIVDQADLLGLRVNTERSRSGAIPGLTPPAPEGPSMVERIRQDLAIPTLDIPKPEDLLARLDLETVKQAEAVQARLKAREEAWKQRIDELPDKQTLEGYKARIKSLKEKKSPLERIAAIKEIDDVQKSIKQDLKSIRQLEDDFKAEMAQLRKDVDALKAAPQADLKRAMALVGLDQGAVQGLAKALLGDEVGQWIQNAYSWYAIAEPYIAGKPPAAEPAADTVPAKTCDTSDGLPCFLVKTLNISGELPLPDSTLPLEGRFENLTDRSDVWGRPAELLLSGGQSGQTGMTLKGVLDRVNPQQAKDTLNLDLSRLPLANLRLSDREEFPLLLQRAVAEVAGKAVIQNGELDMDLTADFLQVVFEGLDQVDGTRIQNALASALATLERFNIKVTADGEFADPTLAFSTSLDDLFRQAVGGLVKTEQDKLSKKLSTELNARLSEKMPELNSQLNGLVSLEDLVGQRLQDFSRIM